MYLFTCGTSSHCSAASMASVQFGSAFSDTQFSQSGHKPYQQSISSRRF